MRLIQRNVSGVARLILVLVLGAIIARTVMRGMVRRLLLLLGYPITNETNAPNAPAA